MEKARVGKASAIIILGKGYRADGGIQSNNNLDADAIFMYKTIEKHYKVSIIVTELASVNAITFLVQDKDGNAQKENHYQCLPFASGEIFVSNLLDSLMCQAFYNSNISEILEQLIMGSANTPRSIMQFHHMMNLSKCSLNLVNIPKQCTSMYFSDIFEFCVKSKPCKIPIAVYKRHTDSDSSGGASG